MATRTYPRDPSEYPEIMSKLDPLIIRVSPTVLLVGSTTYTVKVKLGSMFNGYLIHVSGVGLPILKQEVDISGHSNTNGTGNKGEQSDAWNYIVEQGTDWLDKLEQSMLTNSSSKNIVDLLREIKFQNHFDLSGHTEMIEPYKDSVEVCIEGHTYPQDMLTQLITLNTNLTTLINSINGENGLNARITNVEQKVDNITPALNDITSQIGNLSTTLDNSTHDASAEISEAIQTGLNSLVAQMNVMNTNITTVDTDVNKVYNSVGPARTDGQGPVTIRALLDSWNTNVGYISGIRTNVNSVKSTVETIRSVDVPDIKTTIGNNSSSGAVSDLSGVVSSIQGTVNGIYSKVDYVDGIDVERVNRMVYWLGDSDNKAEHLSYAIHEDNGDYYVDAKILGS